MRKIEYKHILRPSVEYLEECGSLMIDRRGMAEFLGVSAKAMTQFDDTDRIPRPRPLGLGNCQRWSVLELLAWVQAGCPRLAQWVKLRGL